MKRLLAVHFQCYQNVIITERKYTLRYPDRRHYDIRAFPRLRITGNFHQNKFRLLKWQRRRQYYQCLVNIGVNPHIVHATEKH